MPALPPYIIPSHLVFKYIYIYTYIHIYIKLTHYSLSAEPPLHAADMLIEVPDEDHQSQSNEPITEVKMKKVKGTAPTADWPQHGEVVAENLVCSYRAGLDPVIKNISFSIKAGQRVGIVGRTGAGKSSLMSVLLRLIDITSGKLSIDGINVQHIGLHELRPKISVIPQVPFLFMGTIRQNLDMFNEHSDAAIWSAIDALHLRAVLMNKLKGGSDDLSSSSNASASFEVSNPLEVQVSENGSNYSVGERQLLCLCRAILQKNKILIMDEVRNKWYYYTVVR